MKKILKLLSLLLLFSCGSMNNSSKNIEYSLFVGTWKLEEIIIENNPIKDFEKEEKITLKVIKTDNKDQANYMIKASINNYRGIVNIIDDKNIKVNLGMGTKATDTKMERLFVNQFLNELEYSITKEGKLSIQNKNSNTKMIFSYQLEYELYRSS